VGLILAPPPTKKEVKNLKRQDIETLEWYRKIILDLLKKQRTQEELRAVLYVLSGMVGDKYGKKR